MRRWNRWAAPALALLCVAAPVSLTARAGDAVENAAQHYERVERELLEADVSNLSAEQRAARSRMIEDLRAYRTARVFGVNTDFPGARVPYFVDHEGRRCAVAQLLHSTGRDDLVDAVASSANHAYVYDLKDNAAFLAWLDQVGLSLIDAARIQGPGMPWPRPTEESGEDVETGSGAAEQPLSGPDRTYSPEGPTGEGIGSGRSRPASAHTAESTDWWMWWEMNKLDWMRPNVLRLRQGTLTGEPTPVARLAADEAAVERRREQILPRLLQQLSHEDARVRAAACVAVGRLGGAAAVSPLIERLDDPQPFVRRRALLGLGATGSDRAAAILIEIARSGHAPRAKKELAPDARPVAIVALALCRRHGLELPVDGQVADIVTDMKRRDEIDLGTAAVLHGMLSPGDKLARTTEDLAGSRHTDPVVKARAMERLPATVGVDAMASLQRSLVDRKLELRRSAAVALGGVDSDLVLPRLMTAYELEEESLTRGFLLLSIAERGGAHAVPFLRTELRDGPQRLRPWAALALGMVAYDSEVPEARAALAGAQVETRDAGALWLARGMAHDYSALPDLRTALDDADSPMTRAYAATALGLLGGDHARYALLARARVETVPQVRVYIVQSLGLIGHSADADFIVTCAREMRHPGLQVLLAVALGFHGTEAVLDGAEAQLLDKDATPAAVATSIASIGLLLDREPGLALPQLSRRTNFAVMPGWLKEILSSPL